MDAGVYKILEIEDYGITLNKSDEPQAFATLKLESGTMTWYGSFNGKAKEFTIKALLNLGFQGKDLSQLAEPNMIPKIPGQDLTATVEKEEYNGKERTRISWINTTFEVKKLDKAGAVQKMQGMNLDGEFMKIRQEMGLAGGRGVQEVFNQTIHNETRGMGFENFSSDDDIPF